MNNFPKTYLSTLLFFSFVCFLLVPPEAAAKMRSQNKIIAGTPPYVIIKKILNSSRKAAESYTQKNSNFAPYITWLTDPDAKIQPQMILSNPASNIYTSRNMGAQLGIALGQIDYGIRHLHTPILLITLNSDNHAIRYFLEGYDHLPSSMRNELDHLNLPLKKKQTKGNFQEKLLDNIEANIDYQVARAVKRYKDRIDLGRLTIIGSIADYNNSYKRGRGRLIIININGEKNQQKLLDMGLLKTVSPALRQLSIGRNRPKAKKK